MTSPPTVEQSFGIAVLALLDVYAHVVAHATGREIRKKLPECPRWDWSPKHWFEAVFSCSFAPVLLASVLAALHDQVTEDWSIRTAALRLLPYYLSTSACLLTGFLFLSDQDRQPP